MYNKRSKRKSGGARRRGDRRSRLNRRSRVNRRSEQLRGGTPLRRGSGDHTPPREITAAAEAEPATEETKTGLGAWIDKRGESASTAAAVTAMKGVKDMYDDAWRTQLPALMAGPVTDMANNVIKNSLAEVVKILPPTINNMSNAMLSNLAMGVLVSTQGRETVELNLKIKGLAEELGVDVKYLKTDDIKTLQDAVKAAEYAVDEKFAELERSKAPQSQQAQLVSSEVRQGLVVAKNTLEGKTSELAILQNSVNKQLLSMIALRLGIVNDFMKQCEKVYEFKEDDLVLREGAMVYASTPRARSGSESASSGSGSSANSVDLEFEPEPAANYNTPQISGTLPPAPGVGAVMENLRVVSDLINTSPVVEEEGGGVSRRGGVLKWKWEGVSDKVPRAFTILNLPIGKDYSLAKITEQQLIDLIVESASISDSDKTKKVRLVWVEDRGRNIELKINIGPFELLVSQSSVKTYNYRRG